MKEFNFKILTCEEFEALSQQDQDKYLDLQNDFLSQLAMSMGCAKPEQSYHYTRREWFPLDKILDENKRC